MVIAHGRYHLLATLKYVKYGLFLCFIPLLQALIKFNLAAFFTALKQDAFIIFFMSVIALIIWRNSSFTVTSKTICCENGVLFKNARHFNLDTITAIEIKRTIFFRILGASFLNVYFKNSYPVKKMSVCLPANLAQQFADFAMPIKPEKNKYQPSGFDKLILVMLSANILTTSFFVLYTLDRLSKFSGQDFQKIAIEQISYLQKAFSFLLPAGVTMLFSIVFFFILFSLIISVFNTYGFTVARKGNIIIGKGGLVTKIERRIFASAITFSDVRISPFSRVLRRYPVYVCAGGYNSSEMPLLVYKKGDTKFIRQILPEFTIAKDLHKGGKQRNIPYFLWKAIVLIIVLSLLLVVSIRNVPGLYVPICFLLFFAILFFAASLYGAFHEGFGYAKNRTLCLEYSARLTHHLICVYTHDLAFVTRQSALSASNGVCNLQVFLPGPRHFTVRSVVYYLTKELNLYM